MDAVCLATIIGNFLLIFALIRTKMCFCMPWLFIYTYASLNEDVFLQQTMEIYGQSSMEYYRLFYFVDLLNCLLTMKAIQEAYRHSQIIFCTLSIYISLKVMGYAVHYASIEAVTMLRYGLRFVNMACIAVAIVAISSKKGIVYERS